MLLIKRRQLLQAAALVLSRSVRAAASDDSSDSIVEHLQSRWETIKFRMQVGDPQTQLMDALGDEADAAAEQHPGDVKLLIWDGIITSERAGMAGSFSALGLAKRARAILEKAYAMDPAALEAGATVSLGVLYYRVPGFPLAFGNNAKARELLQQAVRIAPTGLDALYFYGDFLFNQGELPQAAAVLNQALRAPPHPKRPLWDFNRRQVARELLAKIAAR